jgi:hypothetical protein
MNTSPACKVGKFKQKKPTRKERFQTGKKQKKIGTGGVFRIRKIENLCSLFRSATLEVYIIIKYTNLGQPDLVRQNFMIIR